ncbi:MFS transporter [Lacinutrix sp. Bg11-31]|uniref:MFS transporter n=1 Tax=Lacinutrix sp. Bg11-31 TaxID=2057808 RepID=UPI000C303834|nr:MFS transporter [Lacinutrix sp. Bg11-31]AUC83688.1 MFS transporter [Lacinutrix sp. Bg11-31]
MKPNIKTLQIIHLALCAGVIVAYIVLSNINSSGDIFNTSEVSTDDYLYIAIPLIAFVASNFIYKFLLKKADKNATEDFNLSVFQTASIARWAILEGSAFIILILKPEFILFGILILIYLILLRPTENRFKNAISFL